MTTYIIMRPSMIAAAILAGVIIAILLLSLGGSFFKELAIRCPPKCTHGDIGKIVDFMQAAKVVTHGSMKEICLLEGSSISAAEIANRTDDADALRFVCSSKVCSGASPKLEVTEWRITSKGNPVFDITAGCSQNAGMNSCTFTIADNKDWS